MINLLSQLLYPLEHSLWYTHFSKNLTPGVRCYTHFENWIFRHSLSYTLPGGGCNPFLPKKRASYIYQSIAFNKAANTQQPTNTTYNTIVAPIHFCDGEWRQHYRERWSGWFGADVCCCSDNHKQQCRADASILHIPDLWKGSSCHWQMQKSSTQHGRSQQGKI